MAHYDIFRHHLAIKYPAYGHALWEPSPGDSYPAVEVGDVGFIRDGRFHRLFNALLPADDPSHENLGVPEYHSQLTLRMRDHIITSTLSPNNFCSARVASESLSRILATGPDSPAEVAFSCRGKQGAVLSLPIQARCRNTLALGQFGEWITKNIDCWFAWARHLGLGIDRMEDIILVTGTHRTRSWTNVAFPGGPEDGQVSLGANVASRGDTVAINWKFSHERNRGAVLNCGPNGEGLLEDQCIFIRGFRVARKFVILPRGLKAAAGPNPDPKGDDYEPDVVPTSALAVPEYRDPLHILLEYIAEEAPHCDMALVHDDDLVLLDGLIDDTSLETLQPDRVLRHLRCLTGKPEVHDATFGPDPSSFNKSANTDAETFRVATLSMMFGGRSPSRTSFSSRQSLDRISNNDRQAGTLVMTERWWRDRYNEIEELGYRLRPRYHPQWEPSWFKTGKDSYTVEDGQATILRAAMDANRIRDGRPVMLKKVIFSDGPHELRINKLFSSLEHSRERDNHCAPLLDVIELSTRFESQQLMVFPLLRPFNQPRIQTFGEFAAFFTQICEGIRFMHQRNVAHRDCTADNIMFDSSKMYPKGFHPVKIDRNRNFKGTAKAYTRTQRPPRYYFIHLGLSRLYPSRDATDEPLRGGDESAPEHRSGRRCNPFHTDIYYIGNLIRQEFMGKCNGFEFMEGLITSMTQDNPAERPPIEEVLQEFSRIRASLSKRKLRSAITSKNVTIMDSFGSSEATREAKGGAGSKKNTGGL